jgi:hypothetical protein
MNMDLNANCVSGWFEFFWLSTNKLLPKKNIEASIWHAGGRKVSE